MNPANIDNSMLLICPGFLINNVFCMTYFFVRTSCIFCIFQDNDCFIAIIEDSLTAFVSCMGWLYSGRH